MGSRHPNIRDERRQLVELVTQAHRVALSLHHVEDEMLTAADCDHEYLKDLSDSLQVRYMDMHAESQRCVWCQQLSDGFVNEKGRFVEHECSECGPGVESINRMENKRLRRDALSEFVHRRKHATKGLYPKSRPSDQAVKRQENEIGRRLDAMDAETGARLEEALVVTGQGAYAHEPEYARQLRARVGTVLDATA